MTFRELLNFFDFDYEKHKDGYSLVDLQGANLGGIEDDRFETPDEMIERLVSGIYGDDYLFSDVDMDIEDYINLYKDDKDHDIYLYYCFHVDELEELPEILECAKLNYYTALKDTIKDIHKFEEDNDYGYHEIMNRDSYTPHNIQVIFFKTIEGYIDWRNGISSKGTDFKFKTFRVNV